MKRGENRLSLPGEVLAAGVLDGGGQLGRVALPLVLLPGGQSVLPAHPRLTAGGVTAQLRLRVVVRRMVHPVEGVGPRRHRLRPQRLLLKGGRHLRRHHAPEVLLQPERLHGSVLHPQPDRLPLGGRLLCGDLLRVSPLGLRVRRVLLRCLLSGRRRLPCLPLVIGWRRGLRRKRIPQLRVLPRRALRPVRRGCGEQKGRRHQQHRRHQRGGEQHDSMHHNLALLANYKKFRSQKHAKLLSCNIYPSHL